MDQDPPGGPPGPVYRDPAEAAHARVEALERELSDARHDLAALQPQRAPTPPTLLSGLQLILISRVIDLSLVALSAILPRLLPPDAVSSYFHLTELAYLAAIVIAVLGLLKLASTDGGATIKLALVGQCLCGGLAVLGLVQSLVPGLTLPFVIVLSLGWRVAILLADLPLLLYYRHLGRRLTAPGLAALATATMIALALQQAGNMFLTVLGHAHGPALLHQLRWVLSAAVGALLVTVAALGFLRARRDQRFAERPGAATRGTARHARAAAGLRLHRAGILVKIIGTLAGGLMLVATIGARSLGSTGALAMTLLIVVLVGNVIALAGLVAYASVPAESGGRSLAIAAALLAGAGLVVDLGSALGVGLALFGGQPELLRSVQLLEPVSLTLSLPALLLLLLSLQRVARHLTAHELAGRARQLAVLVGIVAPLAVLMKLPAVTRELGLVVLGIGVPLLGLAIYIVVRYLALLGHMSRELER